jgi:hypothetical protein
LGDGRDITTAALGSISPATVPGYRLQLVRSEWQPDLPQTTQSRSGARVVCVGSGEITIAIVLGTAALWPAQSAGNSPVIQMTPLDPAVVCRKDDCLAFDDGAVATIDAAQSTGDEPAVLWEAHFAPVPLARIWQCG